MIDLSNRPDWLYEKNPLGKVPVLEEDSFVLPESEVIMEYLEERYPEPALLPADPAARARSGWPSTASTPTWATRTTPSGAARTGQRIGSRTASRGWSAVSSNGRSSTGWPTSPTLPG